MEQDEQHTNDDEISLDILNHVEDLSDSVNKLMSSKSETVFKRYPITVSLLVLLGVTALHEGLKEVLAEFGLLDINPWYLIVFGIVLLSITGQLYKKLNK